MTEHDPRHGALLRRWGRFLGRHTRAVLVFWLLFTLAGFGLAAGAFGNQALFDRLHSGEVVAPGENQDGRALLAQAGQSGFNTYSLAIAGVDLTSPKVAAAGAGAVRDLMAIPHVKVAANPFVVPGWPTSPESLAYAGPGGIPSGRFATVVTYEQDVSRADEQAAQKQVDAVFDRLVEQAGATSSERGGLRTLVDTIIEQIKVDGQRGEGLALPASFLVMVLVFSGFLAAGMPVLGAIASIAGALMSLLAMSHLIELDANAINVVTVLGLGLCIDYGLLIVSRFREEARAEFGGPVTAALEADRLILVLERTLDRAGRTVIFSAVTVAISLLGLMAFEMTFMRAVSAAAISVVVVALAVALSLIPALSLLFARRILKRGTDSSGDTGLFATLSGLVHRVPWVVIGVVSAVLVMLALPTLSMRLVSSGPELLPKGNPERVFYEDFARTYPALGGAQLFVVTKAPEAEVKAWAATAGDRPGIERVGAPKVADNGLVLLPVFTGDNGTGDNSRAAVASLRADRTPFPSWTVGQASGLWDFEQAVKDRAPYAVALVALATLVLLFLMTGSVVIPVKALIMNVLSLGAAFGAIVFIFQEGHFEDLLRFSSTGAVENTIPLLVLAFGFGLSMDYEVFLLSRIVELHEQGHDTDTAVSLGLQRSGRIITSAALLMVIVFIGFSTAQILVMKQMGIALILAVVIDATLVRMLLVPATMSVLGSVNWWAPAILRRFHERWGITE